MNPQSHARSVESNQRGEQGREKNFLHIAIQNMLRERVSEKATPLPNN